MHLVLDGVRPGQALHIRDESIEFHAGKDPLLPSHVQFQQSPKVGDLVALAPSLAVAGGWGWGACELPRAGGMELEDIETYKNIRPDVNLSLI